MHVARLSLTDFRNYAQVDLDLDRGVSTLVGRNGEGKTNLVEAVGYVATLASHRTSAEAALVRSGAQRAVVRTAVLRDSHSTLVELEITPGRANRARLNRSPVPRAREVLGTLRAVLFAPEDLAVVKGDPEGRRRFFDDLLVQRSPRLGGVRADYDRILKQRNALLRSAVALRRGSRTGEADARAATDLSTLQVWDSHLAATGAQLVAARRGLLHEMAPYVARLYGAVSGSGAVPPARMAYRSSWDDRVLDATEDESAPAGAAADVERLRARLLDAIADRRREEVERGTSLVGPHRDDVLLRVGDLPVRGYASHGESWSLALALRLASWHLLRADGGSAAEEPVLMLDDVFAELDAGRRARLADLVGEAGQVLVTAAVADDVPAGLRGTRYEVSAGTVRRA